MALFSKEEIESTLKTLEDWKKQDRNIVVLVDIGGTNTRISFSYLESTGDFLKMTYQKVKSTRIVLQLFQQISKAIEDKIIIHSGIIAIAGRVSENRKNGTMTNFILPKENQEISIEELPRNLFPDENSVFINDLEGCCYGLLFLDQNKQLQNYFQPLWKGREIILEEKSQFGIKKANSVILGMGTGLGVGLIVYSTLESKFYVVPTEFGHAIINPKDPTFSDEESGLISYISNKKYQGKYSVEYEDICSGSGLVFCYNFLVEKMGLKLDPIEAAQISQKSMIDHPNDPYYDVCRKAQEIHYRFLFRLAQNICVALQCKSIFLALDNQVKNNKFVISLADKFSQEFFFHPKNEWLNDVHCLRQISSDENLNITFMGCLFLSQNFFTQKNL
eukprot:Anaeramoba_ignava/a349938_33.p1 GENE.a349938_33~~a349938_33.p1  ORF type:complete len:390 (-),score=143.87 a349938_33:148-1317(-)